MKNEWRDGAMRLKASGSEQRQCCYLNSISILGCRARRLCWMNASRQRNKDGWLFHSASQTVLKLLIDPQVKH